MDKDTSEHVDVDQNNDYPEYPVLRLANPLPEQHPYRNDNDNNMYMNYQHDNDNATSNLNDTANMTTSSTTSSTTTKHNAITNLTAIVTNSHPLMYSPTSPLSPDIPEHIPDKRHSNNYKVSSPRNLHKDSMYNFKPTMNSTLYSSTPVYAQSNYESSPKFKQDSSAQNVKVSSNKKSKTKFVQLDDSSDTENDKSAYKATLSSNFQNVSMKSSSKRLISVGNIRDFFEDEDKSSSETEGSDIDIDDDYDDEEDDEEICKIDTIIFNELLENSDDLEVALNSERPNRHKVQNKKRETEHIEEYSAEEERRDSRHWQKIVLANGEQRSIDMRVIEPYKRVFSHGGYLKAGGHNAIVVFSACFLPDKSRVDYDYVMDNLFLYVLSTLEQLVTEDYVLVYFHGGAKQKPSINWIKKCYELIDRRLRKNLKRLYLVHPTFLVKTLVVMCKPFISSKFYKKIEYVHSLSDLSELLPIEPASIPDRVKNFEKLKFSC